PRDAAAGVASRAEGRGPGVAQLGLTGGAGEALRVPRDGAGPPALDVGDAELVEMPGDGELVGDRQREALLLGAVAQRGVVEVEGADRPGGRGVGGHHRLTPAGSASRAGPGRGRTGCR